MPVTNCLDQWKPALDKVHYRKWSRLSCIWCKLFYHREFVFLFWYMRHQSFFFKYKLHHILFWALVFGLWFYLRYQDYASNSIAFAITLIKVADLALIVYIVNYLLIPRLLYKKKYMAFVSSFLLIIAISGFVKMIIMGQVTGQTVSSSPFDNLKTRFYENVISDFFLVTSGAAFKLIFDYI